MPLGDLSFQFLAATPQYIVSLPATRQLQVEEDSMTASSTILKAQYTSSDSPKL